MLAISLIIEKEPKKFVENVWRKIEKKFNVNYIYRRSKLPHITLVASFEEKDQDKLFNYLEKKVNNINSFELISNGIGIFILKTPLIYIRWFKNIYLEKIRSEIYDEILKMGILDNKDITNINWIPKTTICYKDIKLNHYFLNILKIIRISYKEDMKCIINSLAIIKYNKKGEELIKKYQFKK